MRLSIRPRDSGYANYAHNKRLAIKLNGELQTMCYTADSEAGVIVRVKTDAAGNPIVDKERQEIVDEVLHGKVEIEIYDAVVM